MEVVIGITLTFFISVFAYIGFLYWYNYDNEPEWSMYSNEMFWYDESKVKWLL